MKRDVHDHVKGTGWAACVAAFAVLAAPAWSAALASDPGFIPRVPVSAFGTPAWFDPSRLHITSSVSVGSGFGRNVNALQVTSLSYQFGSPLSMSVSLGNAWGSGIQRSSSSFFLEGLDVAYRPSANLQFLIHYQNLRSPLQLSHASGLWPY